MILYLLFDCEPDGVLVVTRHHYGDISPWPLVNLVHDFLHHTVVTVRGGIKCGLDGIIIANSGSSFPLLMSKTIKSLLTIEPCVSCTDMYAHKKNLVHPTSLNCTYLVSFIPTLFSEITSQGISLTYLFHVCSPNNFSSKVEIFTLRQLEIMFDWRKGFLKFEMRIHTH